MKKYCIAVFCLVSLLGLSAVASIPDTSIIPIAQSSHTSPTQNADNINTPASKQDDLSTYSVDELAKELDRVQAIDPKYSDEFTEEEKWNRVAAITKELLSRDLGAPVKEELTIDILLNFIDMRLDGNYAFLRVHQNRSPDVVSPEYVESVQQETDMILAFREEVLDSNEEIHTLWLYFWNDLLHQEPPDRFL